MKSTNVSMTALSLALAMTGCASNTLTTASVQETKPAEARRATPVVAGRAARMYVMAGFREKDCSPLTPEITMVTPPAKGDVTLTPNQTTVIQFSASGQCVGKQVSGTGIYYTARAGQIGADTFTIAASAGSGPPQNKTFHVDITQ